MEVSKPGFTDRLVTLGWITADFAQQVHNDQGDGSPDEKSNPAK
jgi:hypothetical protein